MVISLACLQSDFQAGTSQATQTAIFFFWSRECAIFTNFLNFQFFSNFILRFYRISFIFIGKIYSFTFQFVPSPTIPSFIPSTNDFTIISRNFIEIDFDFFALKLGAHDYSINDIGTLPPEPNFVRMAPMTLRSVAYLSHTNTHS